MDEFDPTNAPQMPPRRTSMFGGSTLGAFLSGTILGGAITAIRGRILKRPESWRNIGILAVASGLGISIAHLLTRKAAEPQLPADSAAPQVPAPPPLPPQDKPEGLALATVPQILDILVEKNELKPEQKAKILIDIKQGREGFAGELAVADGYITKAQLDTALAAQAARKAEAAIADINAIGTHGRLTGPAWLVANWGNNGVNPPAAAPTRTDGAAAAANIAQNLVLLANETTDPSMQAVISKGVLAAAYLTRGIQQGDSPTVPLGKLGESWRETMNNALILAVQANPASPHAPRDSHGQPVDVYSFIASRNAEVSAGIAQALRQPPQQGTSLGR